MLRCSMISFGESVSYPRPIALIPQMYCIYTSRVSETGGTRLQAIAACFVGLKRTNNRSPIDGEISSGSRYGFPF